MSDVYAVVEGKGEQAFLRCVLAPYLGSKQVWLHAVLVGEPGHKGGVRRWEAVRRDVTGLLKMNRPDRPVYVTTMFDFYRMPASWPGRRMATEKALVVEKAEAVEEELRKDIQKSMGEAFDERKFVPYVQMHELEALVLANPAALAIEFPDRKSEIESIVGEIGDQEPESIDDKPETAPSVRIAKKIPEYKARKASAAANILEEIGLPRLMQQCRHFEAWIQKLGNLGDTNRNGSTMMSGSQAPVP